MSTFKQEFMQHWIGQFKQHGMNEQEIIKQMTVGEIESRVMAEICPELFSFHKKCNPNQISTEEAIEALKIYKYKAKMDEIPQKYIKGLMKCVQQQTYSIKDSNGKYNVFLYTWAFLDGVDLATLWIALGKRGGAFIKKFVCEYIKTNPVLGYKNVFNDVCNVPIYQMRYRGNPAFSYHLRYAPPNLSIIGGPYAAKNNTSLCRKTCLGLYGHRKYLLEKALKAGGLPFFLNVVKRIIIDPLKERQFKGASKVFGKKNVSDYQEFGYSFESQLKNVNKIPRLVGDLKLFNLMCTFAYSPVVDKKFHESFKRKYKISKKNDDEYEKKFGQFRDMKRYRVMGRIIKILKQHLPGYPWNELLTQHLGMAAGRRQYECVGILMDLGAKINLSGKIQNPATCDVIHEVIFGSRFNQYDAIKTLVEIFKRAKEEDFEDEDERISEEQMNAILSDFEYQPILSELKSVLLTNNFVLTESAEERLWQTRF